MQTAIVVAGSVTAKQYEQIRFEALRAGLKPEIARDPFIIGRIDWNGRHSEQEILDAIENFHYAVDAFLVEHTSIFAIIIPARDEERMMLETYLPHLRRLLEENDMEYDYWHVLEDGTLDFRA